MAGITKDQAVQLIETFRREFPGMTRFGEDQEFDSDERAYKLELCGRFDTWYTQARKNIDQAEGREIFVQGLEKLLTQPLASTSQPQNLVGWRYTEVIRKLSPDAKDSLPGLIAELVDGNAPVQLRVDYFVKGLSEAANHNGSLVKLQAAASRSITTFFLFLSDPMHQFFIKTQEINRFLKWCGRAPHSGFLTGQHYEEVLDLAEGVRQALSELGWAPRDMIDIQSFVWRAMDSGGPKTDENAFWRVVLTQGAIDNGYINVGPRSGIFLDRYYGGASAENAGDQFELVLEDEAQAQAQAWKTDIRGSGSGGRVRKRFSDVFRKLGIQANDTAVIRPQGEDSYLLSFERTNPTQAVTDASSSGESMNFPLNRILYGPPGTGKTYHTAKLAVEVCDGQATDNRVALMARYRELSEANRIKFVSFHQSFSYEDFIEGIRPVEGDSDGAGIQYETRPGAFREICALAGQSSSKTEGGSIDLKGRRLFKMSLGNTALRDEDWVFDECIQNGYVVLGFGLQQDVSDCESIDAVWSRLKQVESDIKRTDYHVTAMYYLKNELKIGDLVLISDGNRKFRALAEVTGDYWHIEGRTSYDQARKVRWLAVFEESLPIDTVFGKILSQATIYAMDQKAVKWEALQDLVDQSTGKQERQNYVLIVDEINRANIAKVLGELITLLEPDKRLGAQNELKVELPYSGDSFGIPSNLYIIGTMNTADRSIALLDTALRRRFQFQEVMPDVSAIVGQAGGTIQTPEGFELDLRQMLSVINQRVEYLLGRDHQLGHAYLTQVQNLSDLEDAFRTKLIPLLQEYFHDDWALIAKVLSPEFIKAEEVSGESLFAHAGGVDDGRMPTDYTRYYVARRFTPEMFHKLYARIPADSTPVV